MNDNEKVMKNNNANSQQSSIQSFLQKQIRLLKAIRCGIIFFCILAMITFSVGMFLCITVLPTVKEFYTRDYDQDYTNSTLDVVVDEPQKEPTAYKLVEDAQQTLCESIYTAIDALQEQSNNITISSITFIKLTQNNSDYADIIEFSNGGGCWLSVDDLDRLIKKQIQKQIATIESNCTRDEERYIELSRDVKKLDDEQNKEREELKLNIARYKVMKTELQVLAGTYYRFLVSKNMPEPGDMYDDARAAMQIIKDVRTAGTELTGKTGLPKYQAALEFVVGDVADDEKELDRAVKAAERYVTESGVGLANFLQDLVYKGFFEDAEEGGSRIADGTTIDRIRTELIDGLTLSEDIVLALFGELEEYGWEFKWDDPNIIP